jgi:hypothetical protein
MDSMHYIGLDIHKKTISFCVKRMDGTICQEGVVPARRSDLDLSMETLPQPWMAAKEATIFTSWVYDHLGSRSHTVKVAHPAMLKAIAASNRKNDPHRRSQDCRSAARRPSAGVLHAAVLNRCSVPSEFRLWRSATPAVKLADDQEPSGLLCSKRHSV